MESGHVIIYISVFRETGQEEVTVVIGILYDLTKKCDLLHQKGYLKRGNLAHGKQVTFHETTIGFPQNGCQWNEQKNSILITCHYQDLY